MPGEREAMTYEAFLDLAAMLGLDAADGHLEALFPEVSGLLERVAAVHEIDASSVPFEAAGPFQASATGEDES